MEARSLRRPVRVFGNVRDYPAERRTSDRDGLFLATGTRDARKGREGNPGWRCLTSDNKYSRRSCTDTNLLFLQNGTEETGIAALSASIHLPNASVGQRLARPERATSARACLC
ncbi:hypothetical protein SRHO_G00016400 [Serrasalmus rhombeus]